jgi:hypothetical protein
VCPVAVHELSDGARDHEIILDQRRGGLRRGRDWHHCFRRPTSGP